MLIRLDDPSLVDDLCAHYRRSAFVADPAGGSMILVEKLDAASVEQAEKEIRMHLHVWQLMYPDAGVEPVP
jgi:hypothetical protein